jgi:hypothetical protein
MAMAIDIDEFAEACARSAIEERVLPEYVVAVAKVRSDISEGANAKGAGPFGLSQAQWDSAIQDKRLSDFKSGDIKDWDMQVPVFAVMTSVAEDALRQKTGQDINMIELYNAQFPDDQITSADLDAALKAIEPAVTKALTKIGAEFAAMTDSNAPLPASGFGPGPFPAKAALVMKQLLKDFAEFNKVHAAAILGNIFVESAGFTAFHEKGLPFEKGGIGWCQWTGRPGRRQDFEKFCDAEKLDIRTDEASYKFMVHEMRNTPERAVVTPLSQMTDLDDATEFFMRKYERPGAPALAQRQKGAKTALDAFDAGG